MSYNKKIKEFKFLDKVFIVKEKYGSAEVSNTYIMLAITKHYINNFKINIKSIIRNIDDYIPFTEIYLISLSLMVIWIATLGIPPISGFFTYLYERSECLKNKDTCEIYQNFCKNLSPIYLNQNLRLRFSSPEFNCISDNISLGNIIYDLYVKYIEFSKSIVIWLIYVFSYVIIIIILISLLIHFGAIIHTKAYRVNKLFPEIYEKKTV